MIRQTDRYYGHGARNRLAGISAPGPDGAYAALESFYYALNRRDPDVLRQVWADEPLAQLNNPLGGILRGGPAIADPYDRILRGPVRVEVTFNDIVAYLDDRHAVFVGRETGTYTVPDGCPAPLQIRTTRYFRHADGRWRQYHHHGSIDDPDALRGYQRAVAG